MENPRSTIKYAGFGLLVSHEFRKALFGPKQPRYHYAIIKGFNLRECSLRDLPSGFQHENDVPADFKIYGPREGEGKIRVLVLELTPQQLKAVSALNFGDELFDRQTRQVMINGQIISLTIDVLKGDKEDIRTRVDGETYPPYLNPQYKEGLISYAEKLYTRYSLSQQEGTMITGERAK